MNATPEDFSYGIHQLRQATQTLVATGAEVTEQDFRVHGDQAGGIPGLNS